MKNVLEYLDNAAVRFPNKLAAKDEKTECTYEELWEKSRQIGTYVSKRVSLRKPVVVFMEKGVEALQIFMCWSIRIFQYKEFSRFWMFYNQS